MFVTEFSKNYMKKQVYIKTRSQIQPLILIWIYLFNCLRHYNVFSSIPTIEYNYIEMFLDMVKHESHSV